MERLPNAGISFPKALVDACGVPTQLETMQRQ